MQIVIVRRQKTRVLTSAEELQKALTEAGMVATIVDFSALSFSQQVQCFLEPLTLPPPWSCHAFIPQHPTGPGNVALEQPCEGDV